MQFLLFDAQFEIFQGVRHDLCLIYDRPERTGSTTISHSLYPCWHEKFGVRHYDGPNSAGRAAIKMLDSNQSVVAHGLRHIYFSDRDCLSIYHNCKQIFHVTSTRPMSARLASFAKVFALQNDYGRNFSVSTSHSRKAARLLTKVGRCLEHTYERGVYRGKRKIKVDYVVRHQLLNDDLSALLRAFDCKPFIEAKNIHNVKSSTADVSQLDISASSFLPQDLPTEAEVGRMNKHQLYHFLNNFPLENGDRLHNEFMKLADRVNGKGLKKASSITSIFQKSLLNSGR